MGGYNFTRSWSEWCFSEPKPPKWMISTIWDCSTFSKETCFSIPYVRIKENPPYIGDRTEICLVPAGEDQWESLKPLVACKWPLLCLLTIQLRGSQYSMKGLDSTAQWLPHPSESTVRSREVTLHFLNVPRYRRRTEDIEGDSRNKTITRTRC